MKSRHQQTTLLLYPCCYTPKTHCCYYIPLVVINRKHIFVIIFLCCTPFVRDPRQPGDPKDNQTKPGLLFLWFHHMNLQAGRPQTQSGKAGIPLCISFHMNHRSARSQTQSGKTWIFLYPFFICIPEPGETQSGTNRVPAWYARARR